jgi:hypothetical protein
LAHVCVSSPSLFAVFIIISYCLSLFMLMMLLL